MISGTLNVRGGTLEYCYYTPAEAAEAGIDYLADWRSATEEDEGRYVLTDSGVVAGPISVYDQKKRGLRKYPVVRIPTGTFFGSPAEKMTHEERENRWTFNGKTPKSSRNDPQRPLSHKERRFVRFLFRYMMSTYADTGSFDTMAAAELAYIAVTPKANIESPHFRHTVRRFARRANVENAIDDRLEGLLAEEGINDRYIIKGFKRLADGSDSDHVKFSVLREFAKMRNLIRPDSSTFMPPGRMVFAGYSNEEIEAGRAENAKRELPSRIDAPVEDS